MLLCNLGSISIEDFEVVFNYVEKVWDGLRMFVIGIRRIKSIYVRCVLCFVFGFYFILVIWGREFLFLLVCFSCFVGVGDFKIVLLDIRVKEFFFFVFDGNFFVFIILEVELKFI